MFGIHSFDVRRAHLNCVFKPTKTCHLAQPAPLSATETCGSMNTLKTTFSRRNHLADAEPDRHAVGVCSRSRTT